MMKDHGYSLLELVLSLAVVSVLFFVAVPTWHSFSTSHRINERTSELEGIVNFSRNLALSKQTVLRLRPIHLTNWSDGVVLVNERGIDSSKESTEEVLRVWSWHDKQIFVSWNGFQSKDYLEFSDVISKSQLSGHFSVYTKDSALKRSLVVNRLGRTRIENE